MWMPCDGSQVMALRSSRPETRELGTEVLRA